MRYFTLFLVLVVAISAGNSDAADDELFIPRISGIPSLSDFEGMEPKTEIAHSMGKVGEFLEAQRLLHPTKIGCL